MRDSALEKNEGLMSTTDLMDYLGCSRRQASRHMDQMATIEVGFGKERGDRRVSKDEVRRYFGIEVPLRLVKGKQ